jgi:hypothetical protein
MRVVLVALLLAGCVGNVAAIGPVGEARIATPAGSDRAVAIARLAWARRLEVVLPAETPKVVWFAGDSLYYPRFRGVLVASAYWPQVQEIHLAARGGKPSDTGLAHEMLHWALLKSSGSGDARHALPIWKQVGEVTEGLRKVGL